MKIISYSITENKGKISEIVLGKELAPCLPLEKICNSQIKEYFSGKRKTFSVPLLIEGTDFQKKVWKKMRKIPYGKTISYGELAKKIGKPKAYRAVANACGANKIPIIIPCHRVVASNGIGGYSAGIRIKKKLLNLERFSSTKA